MDSAISKNLILVGHFTMCNFIFIFITFYYIFLLFGFKVL